MQTKQHHITDFNELSVEKLIGWLSCTACVLLCLFALKHFLAANYIVAAVLAGLAVALIANLMIYRLTQRLPQLQWGFIGLVWTMFVFLVLSGIEQGSGILWLYAFPPLVFYISSLRVGAWLSFSGLALVTLFLLPLRGLIGHDYDMDFRALFLLSFAFEVVFCYVLDASRRKVQKRMLSVLCDLDFAARHDGLTELYNRREATHRLHQEYERYQRSKRPFSIILIDIDHFKQLNDTYGHEAGDLALKQVARVLLETSRKVDMISRWGGEEFLILLPDTSQADASSIAQRIRQQMAALTVPYGDARLQVTLSAGLTDIEGIQDVDELLRVADTLLYDAKAQGRNCICVRQATSAAGDSKDRPATGFQQSI